MTGSTEGLTEHGDYGGVGLREGEVGEVSLGGVEPGVEEGGGGEGELSTGGCGGAFEDGCDVVYCGLEVEAGS